MATFRERLGALRREVKAMLEQDKRYGDAPLLLPRSCPTPIEPGAGGLGFGLNVADTGLNPKRIFSQSFNQFALKAAQQPE